MTDETDTKTGDEGAGEKSDYEPFPAAPVTSSHAFSSPSGPLAYTATAGWTTVRSRKNVPLARMFHVAYVADDQPAEDRPVTFVFNGGPGAASVYLHMGALGPQRVLYTETGAVPPPPARVVDNAESWLPFTDLVFIDPVGTGFSRSLDRPKKDDAPKGTPEDDKENAEFWETERDLESIGEFIAGWLSGQHRWLSPTYIAGESYGGFRVAKLTRRLQENHGVALCGSVLISPAIEFQSLIGSDYNFMPWLERFPTQVAVAHAHDRCVPFRGKPLDEALRAAEEFANTELLGWLSTATPPSGVEAAASRMSELCGIDAHTLIAAGGRLTLDRFCRLLLADRQLVVGRYDGSVVSHDPYPDRPLYEAPDPTLAGIGRLYAAGINQQLRDTLGVETDLEYRLLSHDVHGEWRFGKDSGMNVMLGAMDDLRFGMALNEFTRVFVCHGWFDLVTPYYSSDRIAKLMKLTDDQRSRLTLEHYRGGHMFYSWDESRVAFTASMQRFFEPRG